MPIPPAAIAEPRTVSEYHSLTVSQMKAILQNLREHPARKSPLVYHCGMRLLRDSPGILGDDIWAVCEQTLIAALDCNEIDDAEYCFTKLAERFSMKSNRVLRLRAMILEATHEYVEADGYYKEILEDTHSCDQRSAKRRVALLKAQGKREEAINMLQEYLNLYHADSEGYHELADLYLADCNYTKAVSCFDELILHDPQNYLFMLKCAEAMYSAGGKVNLLDARKYFAQSIKLNDTVGNLRAYYGIWMTCVTLASQFGMRTNSENVSLLTWCTGKVKTMYDENSSARVSPVVGLMIKNTKQWTQPS